MGWVTGRFWNLRNECFLDISVSVCNVKLIIAIRCNYLGPKNCLARISLGMKFLFQSLVLELWKITFHQS